jgi:hypothetical protein
MQITKERAIILIDKHDLNIDRIDASAPLFGEPFRGTEFPGEAVEVLEYHVGTLVRDPAVGLEIERVSAGSLSELARGSRWIRRPGD